MAEDKISTEKEASEKGPVTSAGIEEVKNLGAGEDDLVDNMPDAHPSPKPAANG